jgi:hypothetical protein
MVKPKGPLCWSVICTMLISPVTAFITLTGIVVVPTDTPILIDVRPVVGTSLPLMTHVTLPTVTSSVTSLPASAAKTAAVRVVLPAGRVIETVLPGAAAFMLLMAVVLGVGAGAPPPPPPLGGVPVPVLMVNDADMTALSIMPDLTAIALTVDVADTVNAPAYKVLPVSGVEPSVV